MVKSVRAGFLRVTIDHRKRPLSFGATRLEDASVREQLTDVTRRLAIAVGMIFPEGDWHQTLARRVPAMPAMPLPLLPDGTRAALACLLAAAALLSSARRVLAHRQCSVRARAPGGQDAASAPQQSPAHALQLRIRAVGASWRRDRPATPSARGPKPEICRQRHPLRMISVRDSVCCLRATAACTPQARGTDPRPRALAAHTCRGNGIKGALAAASAGAAEAAKRRYFRG